MPRTDRKRGNEAQDERVARQPCHASRCAVLEPLLTAEMDQGLGCGAAEARQPDSIMLVQMKDWAT